MKANTFNSVKLLMVVCLTALFSGCSDYLDNPLKDKETGDDINLLIIDFNFFNTRLTYKILDDSDGSVIKAPANIYFTGRNGNDIVTFSGEKKEQFNTSEGQLELTVDPNISISSASPFEFAVNVEVEGYNTLSKGFQLRNEGKKTIELRLSKESDEDDTDLGGSVETGDGDTTVVFSSLISQNLKSAEVDKPFKTEYEIAWSDLIKMKNTNGDLFFNSSAEAWDAYENDPENFASISVKTYSGHSPEIDVIYSDGSLLSVLFHKLQTGKLDRILITGQQVGDLNGGTIQSFSSYTKSASSELFGFAQFDGEAWSITGTDTVYTQLNFNYTLASASDVTLCETGSSITFSSGVTSSFSIDADVYDTNGILLTTLNFKGSFPETFVVENTPQQAVKIVFRNNNPAFKPIPDLDIDDFCTGSYNVEVEPQDGYVEYQLVLKAFCPDNPTVAVAPTYSGDFKIKNSDNPWQGVDMVGGVADVLGLPDQEYQLRLLWENEWEYSTLYTEFDKDGNYLHTTGSDNITSKKLPDGRIRINIDHTFEQDVCDDMEW